MIRSVAALVVLWLLVPLPIRSAPRVADSFSLESVLPTGMLRSGIAAGLDGILLCEFDRGRILQVSRSRSLQILATDLPTPVDVEFVDGDLWVLLEDPGTLVAVHLTSGEQEIIAEGLERPTAFVSDKNGHVYVVEYGTGVLLAINLQTGEQMTLRDDLEGPADIALLPGGDLMVTEQQGLDFRGGRITRLTPDGAVLAHIKLVDATGIAVSPNGTIYATTFLMENVPPPDGWGGIVAIRDEWIRPVVSGLIGPTSLAVLPDGRLGVIEQSTDSVFLVDEAGIRTPLVRGISTPLGLGAFTDGAIAVLQDLPPGQVSLIDPDRVGSVVEPIWTLQSSFPTFPPQLTVGGDGLIYLYEPLASMLHVLCRSGEEETPFLSPPCEFLATDPVGGVALLTRGEGTAQVIRASLQQGISSPQTIPAQNVVGFFIRSDGTPVVVEDQMLPPGPMPSTTRPESARSVEYEDMTEGGRYLVAPGAEDRIWMAAQGGKSVFLREGEILSPVVDGIGEITCLAADAHNGLLIGTARGGLYRLTARTPVADWLLR